MNEILQKRIERAVKKTACPQCVFNDGGTCNNDDDCKLFDDFVGLMAFALQNQWISVEEALPEYEECVLAHFEGEDEVGAMFSQRSKPSDNLILDKNGFQVVGFTEVTHWMSIPKLKEGKK